MSAEVSMILCGTLFMLLLMAFVSFFITRLLWEAPWQRACWRWFLLVLVFCPAAVNRVVDVWLNKCSLTRPPRNVNMPGIWYFNWNWVWPSPSYRPFSLQKLHYWGHNGSFSPVRQQYWLFSTGISSDSFHQSLSIHLPVSSSLLLKCSFSVKTFISLTHYSMQYQIIWVVFLRR